MNKKENQQFSDDRELQNRFTAYVQKAMENTRNTYYKKKIVLHEHEALYDEFGDTLLVESDDILNAIFTLDMDLIENLSLWKAIRKLSDMDVMIIKLHVLYDNNFNEIAHVLGMKEAAVRQRYNRAIHAIRKICIGTAFRGGINMCTKNRI